MEKSKLYGLILSGGKSTRMGSDKGLLEYHGKPQRDYLYDLAKTHCDAAFYSVREEQVSEMPKSIELIIDKNTYRGPFNGILSAHETHPEAAWLVIACDLPLLNAESIGKLVSERDENKYATSFATRKTKLPEPLITIWEPHGLKAAKEYLETAESSCPRKFLLNSDIKIIFPKNDEVLYNANSLEEYSIAKSKIQ